MIIKFDRLLKDNPRTLMRRCGYKPWRDPRTHQETFIKQMSPPAYYPRFHVRCSYDSNYRISIDLHLDWRRPMHKKGIKSTEGEESLIVTKESERIKALAMECK